MERVYSADRSEINWTPEQEAAFVEKAHETLVRALILAAETGASQGDLLRLSKAADRGEIIVGGRRSKTSVAWAAPVSPRLREAITAMPATDATTILTTKRGRPWTGNGFRDAWRKACTEAGIEGVTFNDLRGTFITKRRAMGWTAEETALCSGHPIEGERGAQKVYAHRAVIAEANAKRLWARWYGPNTEQNLQTGAQTAPTAEELKA